MKTDSIFRYLLMLLCAIMGQVIQAENIKVSSRMSFYTDEKEAEIIVYLPLDHEDAVAHMTEPNRSYTLKPGVNLITVDTKSMQLGSNRYKLTITDKESEILHSVELLKLTQKPNEVKIDRLNGNLLINGWQWFPIGFYSSLAEDNYLFLKSEVTQGINLYSPYHNITPPRQSD